MLGPQGPDCPAKLPAVGPAQCQGLEAFTCERLCSLVFPRRHGNLSRPGHKPDARGLPYQLTAATMQLLCPPVWVWSTGPADTLAVLSRQGSITPAWAAARAGRCLRPAQPQPHQEKNRASCWNHIHQLPRWPPAKAVARRHSMCAPSPCVSKEESLRWAAGATL